MRRRCHRGLTLIEAVIASALAIVLGFLMLQFISSSLGAHRKGQLSRSAQAGTRSLVSLLVSELRSASVPPLSSPVVSTPVFWPGVWGAAQEGDGLGALYPREEIAEEDTLRDQASNRLFYVRSAENSDQSDLDPLARYALVELLVSENKPGMLERRVHRLSGSGSLLRVESAQGADNATRRVWMIDVSALSTLPAPAAPDILYDAGPDSRIAFRISHLKFQPSSDPGRTRNPEIFDPGNYRVEVAVAYEPELTSAVNQPWPRTEQWSTMRSETTELRIPSVRSR